MTTTTAPAPATEADPPPMTWHDAVTPLSRTSRRRWTACYALLLVLLAASVLGDTFSIQRADMEAIPLILFGALVVVFGMLARGTRRVAAIDHPDLDERDLAARNRAYRVAFPLFAVVVVAGLVLLVLGLPDTTRTTRLDDGVLLTEHGWYVEAEAVIGLGLWFLLWAVFLPTGVLAWSEPDPLDPGLGAGGLGEPVRDALLAVALTAGVVSSLITDSDIGFYGFAVGLLLLGALARRASGQPAVSRPPKVLGITTIALILLLAAFVFSI